MTQQSDAARCAEIISQLAPQHQPKTAIILGSGLGQLAADLEDAVSIPYHELPGFPVSSVVGHAGEMVVGLLEGKPVVCLKGRPHVYEGVKPAAIKTYIRSLKLLGIENLIATNASGSLREEVPPGELVLINDHINFQGFNPLIGPNDDEFGPRFFPVDDVYNPTLREHFQQCAHELDIELHDGVYISVLGPNYETAAEIRAFKTLGAEVIGMSTVPEILVAHHCGLHIALIATITNYATGLASESHSHDAVVEAANAAAGRLTTLIKCCIPRI